MNALAHEGIHAPEKTARTRRLLQLLVAATGAGLAATTLFIVLATPGPLAVALLAILGLAAFIAPSWALLTLHAPEEPPPVAASMAAPRPTARLYYSSPPLASASAA